jgi:hypothetical protein
LKADRSNVTFCFSLRVTHLYLYLVMSTSMVGYVFQEYPKWVGSVLVQDAAEEKTLRVAMAQAAVETRPTKLARPPSAVALRMRRTRTRKKEGRRAINLDISVAQVEALAAAGFLDHAMRDDAVEVARGVGRLMDGLPRSGPIATAPMPAKATA